MVKSDPTVGPSVQALDTMTAATMTRMMQSVVIYGTANALRSQFCTHCDFAGKTGTTQNHSDGWLIAYNPKLVTGAWVGGPSPAVRFRSMNLGSGAAMALPIVGNFWYSVSIDPKSAKITQEKFTVNEKVNSLVACPFRIPTSLDTFNLLMQDTLLKDSLLRSGFKNMRQIVNDKFGLHGDSIDINNLEMEPTNPENPESKNKDSDKNKKEIPKSTLPKAPEKKKQEDTKKGNG